MKRVVNRILFIVICSLLILSCQTNAPKKTASPLVSGTRTVPLEPGALVYVFADPREENPLLNLFFVDERNDKQVKQIIDKTKLAVVGFYPSKNERNYQIVAWGNYPAGQGAMALDMSKGWNKQRAAAGYDYWYAEANKLSVAMNAKQIFATLSRTSAPVEPLGAGVTIPDGFSEFRKGSLLALWIADPNPMLQKLELPLQLKVDQVFMSFSTSASSNKKDKDKLYEGALRLELPGPNEARALMGMLSMAKMFAPPRPSLNSDARLEALGMLLANPPVVDGKSITIKTSPLSNNAIALLFNLFSL